MEPVRTSDSTNINYWIWTQFLELLHKGGLLNSIISFYQKGNWGLEMKWLAQELPVSQHWPENSNLTYLTQTCGFPGATSGKINPPVNAGDMRHGFDPWVGKSPGGGHGNPLQYSCLENPKDRGAWWTIVYRVRKSQRQLKWLSMQRNTNLVSFNCTTSWCFLESDLFWSKTAIKVMLDLLLSF